MRVLLFLTVGDFGDPRIVLPIWLAGLWKSSLVHSADLCIGVVRVRVKLSRFRGRVRALIDRYAV